MIVFVVVGVLIISVLAIVAYRLQKKVWLMETTRREQEKAIDEEKEKKRDTMNKSIQILAQGLLSDQLTSTEGAIRIGALLEFLSVDEAVKEEYSAFFQLAEATAYIPILDKWKALPTKEKLRYDSERMVLEKTYADFVLDAAKRIIGKTF